MEYEYKLNEWNDTCCHQRVLLLEAIAQLEYADYRFVIVKRLEGYNNEEIAILLQKKWQKLGIKKHDANKGFVVPDATYVNVCTQQAIVDLRTMMSDMLAHH